VRSLLVGFALFLTLLHAAPLAMATCSDSGSLLCSWNPEPPGGCGIGIGGPPGGPCAQGDWTCVYWEPQSLGWACLYSQPVSGDGVSVPNVGVGGTQLCTRIHCSFPLPKTECPYIATDC